MVLWGYGIVNVVMGTSGWTKYTVEHGASQLRETDTNVTPGPSVAARQL